MRQMEICRGGGKEGIKGKITDVWDRMVKKKVCVLKLKLYLLVTSLLKEAHGQSV